MSYQFFVTVLNVENFIFMSIKVSHCDPTFSDVSCT